MKRFPYAKSFNPDLANKKPATAVMMLRREKIGSSLIKWPLKTALLY